MKLKENVNKSMETNHKAHFRKVAGIGLVAGALIMGAAGVNADEVSSSTGAELVATTTSEAVAVDSVTTASISTTTEVDGLSPFDAGRYYYDVETTLTGSVKEGDYVEYEFNNLPHNGLDGNSLTVADGTVIGTLSKVSESNSRSIEMNGSDAQKESLDVGSYNSVYRAVFHNTVENLQDITYKFSLVNGNNVWTYVDENTPLTSIIKANGDTVAEYTTTIKAIPEEKQSKPIIYQSSSQATYTPSTVEGTRYNQNIVNANETPIKAGDLLTTTLNDDAGIVFDTSSVNVGQVFTVKDVGSNNSLAKSNANGVVLFDDQQYRFEVVEVTENSITYKALDDFKEVDGRYGGLATKFIVVDENIIDLSKDVLNVSGYTSTVKSSDGKEKSTREEAVTIPIVGTKISASAITIPRSSVSVEYVAEDGTVLKEKANVLSNEKVGTAYSTEGLEFGGYKLTKTPENATGSSTVEDILVTYVYKKNVGSVTVEHVAEDGKVLKAKSDVAKDEVVGTKYNTSSLTADELAKLAPETKVEDLKDRTITTTYKYELVSTPGNATGEVTEGTTAVKYTYKLVADSTTVMKRGSVTVEHVAEDGTILKAKEDVARDEVVGTNYMTTPLTEAELKELAPEPKVVEDDDKIVTTTYHYELVEVPTNAEGEVAEGETEVIYVYKLVETVETVVKPKPVVSQPKSETPTPQKVEEVPVVKQAAVPTLPNTGDGATVATAVAGALSTIIGILGFAKRKED